MGLLEAINYIMNIIITKDTCGLLGCSVVMNIITTIPPPSCIYKSSELLGVELNQDHVWTGQQMLLFRSSSFLCS